MITSTPLEVAQPSVRSDLHADGLHGERPVLQAQALLDLSGLGNAMRALRIRMALPPELFGEAVQRVVCAYAEFVQDLPSSRSWVETAKAGLLQEALVRTIRALDRRRGQILPRGAAPEVIGELAHRWTYAVFVGALLGDLSVTLGQLRVWIVDASESRSLWLPDRGSMHDLGGVRYSVDLLPARAVAIPGIPLAWTCFERWVPRLVRDWLHEDPALMEELRACLTGPMSVSETLGALLWGGVRQGLQPAAGVSDSPASPSGSTDAGAPGPLELDRAEVAPPDRTASQRPVDSPLAGDFMGWLGNGVGSGAIPVNQADALVAMVEEGLLLVSPAIFRQFAKRHAAQRDLAADLAVAVQRDVLREGWHLRAGKGVNMLCYERRRPGKVPLEVHGIVIREPRRFLEPLPPIDPSLVRVVERDKPQG